MNIDLIDSLETPCIVIDTRQAEKNIISMQEKISKTSKLRPHIKTHKMEFFLKKQLEAGAAGISCAKIAEAEIMAQSGATDIFIAYPMVGDFRIKRALLLNKKIKRLILAVDSVESANRLELFANIDNQILEVRMEVDTGVGRTGVSMEDAVFLAEHIDKLPHLHLTGIYTFKSMVYEGQPTTDIQKASEEEVALLLCLSEQLKEKGFHLEISAGSTPTAIQVAHSGNIHEVRPGTYVFYDYMMYKEGACRVTDIACRYYATVISVKSKGRAIIDGGTKTFPMDIRLDTAPYYYDSYAIVEGENDFKLRTLYEEHGIITSESENITYKVGDKISLIPVHICTAINMQNKVYLYDGTSIHVEPVIARGQCV